MLRVTVQKHPSAVSPNTPVSLKTPYFVAMHALLREACSTGQTYGAQMSLIGQGGHCSDGADALALSWTSDCYLSWCLWGDLPKSRTPLQPTRPPAHKLLEPSCLSPQRAAAAAREPCQAAVSLAGSIRPQGSSHSSRWYAAPLCAWPGQAGNSPQQQLESASRSHHGSQEDTQDPSCSRQQAGGVQALPRPASCGPSVLTQAQPCCTLLRPACWPAEPTALHP